MGSEARSGSSRLLTAARFLWRSLRHRGAAFLLALLAITVGATVVAAVLHLKADVGAKMSKELRAYGPNLVVAPAADAGPAAVFPTLDEVALRGAAPAVVPLLMAAGAVNGSPALIVGADLDALLAANPAWSVAGGRDAALPGAALARRAGLAPGGTASIDAGGARRDLAASGVLTTGESEDDQMFVPLAVLQEMTGLGGRVSAGLLSVEGGEVAVRAAAERLEAALPGASARPLRRVAEAQGALLARLDRMMAALAGVILLLSALCLVMTLMSIVVEREAEIGLVRSLGGGDGAILKMFLGEVGLLALCGSALGLALGALAARFAGLRLFGAAIEPRLAVVPAVVLATIAVCAVAVIVPLRRALHVQPAAALRGD